MSTDQYHAMILRGDIKHSAPNYTVAGGQDATTFVQFGGNYRFRQVTNLMNALLFEITPTHVNVGNSLRIGGTSTDTLYQQRAWIQAIIPSATVNGPVTITTQSGVATASASRSATGTHALTWSPNINNANYLVQGNVRNAAGFVSFNGTGELKIYTYTCSCGVVVGITPPLWETAVTRGRSATNR